MILKCIGGPSDGKRVNVVDSSLFVTVRNPLPGLALKSYEAVVDQGDTVYTRRVLRQVVGAEMEEIQYLAPEGMSDIESIRHMFA